MRPCCGGQNLCNRRCAKSKQPPGHWWFCGEVFPRDKNPQLTALEREIKILATLPESPYIVGFHGQFSVKKDDPALQEVAKNLLPKRRDSKDLEDHSLAERAETISVILVDRCDCTLTSMIQKTALPESHSAFTMDGLLRGIAHLHAQRIVHRDIKDVNVLIADSGRRVCLCDFDLATYIPEDAEVIDLDIWHRKFATTARHPSRQTCSVQELCYMSF